MACNGRIGIYLIGYEAEDLAVGYGLPTCREVLSYFFYQHNTLKQTIRASARCAVKRCSEIWQQFGISTTCENSNSIVKLEALFKEWKSLKESVNDHDSEMQLIREFTFEHKLRQIFNVTGRNALDCITNVVRLVNSNNNNNSSSKRKQYCYSQHQAVDRVTRVNNKIPSCKKQISKVRRVIKL